MRRGARALFLNLTLLLTAALASAQEPPAERQPAPESLRPRREPAVQTAHVFTLRRCLTLAEQNYPKIYEAKAKLNQKRAQLFQARTAPYSEFNLTAGLGPAPVIRGTSLYSPNTDATLTTSMALAWQASIEGAIPLWTFGKITNLVDAATAQVAVGEHEVKKEKNELKLNVRKAYYGTLLARDALALLHEATKRIDKHLERMAEAAEDDEGDDVDMLKLRMFRAELDARESEARRQERIALAGLRFMTGVTGAFEVPDVPLKQVSHTLLPLSQYLTAARLFRPEINMARAGVAARRALVRLEQSRYFPDIGAGLSVRYARAPEVADQLNPFVRDNGNFLLYGAALVMRWKLDFLPQAARLAQAQAQLEEIRATERFALGGIGVEVEQAFAEANDAARRLDAYSRATNYARQWLIKVQQGIEVGTFEDEEIVEPAKEYALKRFLQMQAVFDYNMSIAKLSQVTGWDSVAEEG